MSYELCSAVQSLNISPEQFTEIIKNVQPSNWSTILAAIISAYLGSFSSLYMYTKQRKDKEKDEKRIKEEENVAKVNLLLLNLLQSIDDQIANIDNLEKSSINKKKYAIREVADYNCIYEYIKIFSMKLPEILYELNMLKNITYWIKEYGDRFYKNRDEENKSSYRKEINKALKIIIPSILVIYDYACIKFKGYNILNIISKKTLKHKIVTNNTIIKRLNNKDFFLKKYQYNLVDECVLQTIIGQNKDDATVEED